MVHGVRERASLHRRRASHLATSRVLGWTLIFTISLFSDLWAENRNRAFFFNTYSDFLRGDHWQWISSEEVSRRLYVYPERFLVMGMGNVSWPERMSETIVEGTIKRINYRWADPEYPYKLKNIQDGPFPWLHVAVVDPDTVLEARLEKTPDLHRSLMEKFRREGIEMCAVEVEAETKHVEYTVTYRIPKTGLDLSVEQGRAAYFRAFQDEGDSIWTMKGIYIDETVAPSCGIPPGQPLMLVGYNQGTLHAGLIKMARIQGATVRYYPVKKFEIFKSDLTVSDIRVHEDRVTVEVRNEGSLVAEHVKLRLSFPDTGKELEAVLPRINPQGEISIRFNVKAGPSDRTIVAVVDPEDQIAESNEANNKRERKVGLFGW